MPGDAAWLQEADTACPSPGASAAQEETRPGARLTKYR